MLLGAAAFFLHLTRGATFHLDEWQWLLDRRGDGVHSFLDPHNQHLSVVPVVVYKILFATAGADHYLPYRIIGIATHLVTVVLLYAYAERRVGPPVALLAALLLLMLGAGWENILWPFQIGYLGSLASGIGALMMLDRRDRMGDVGAAALMALSIGCSGVGVAIAIGIVLELVWTRRRELRQLWVFAVPLVLYGLWWIGFQEPSNLPNTYTGAPLFAIDSVAAAFSGLFGLTPPSIEPGATALEWGRPLAVAGVALIVWRLAVLRAIPPRVVTLLTIVVAFWVLTGVRRGAISGPEAGRYVYVGGTFLLLTATELLRGVRVSWRTLAIATAVVIGIVVADIGFFRKAGEQVRGEAQIARADLGVLEMTRGVVKPDYIAHMPGYPFLAMHAGDYFAMAADVGTPAASPEEIARSSETARQLADEELGRIYGITLVSAGEHLPGRCRTMEPGTFVAPGAVPRMAVAVPPRGVQVKTTGAPANVRLRRFAQTFPKAPFGTVTPGHSALLRIRSDAVARPWQLEVESTGRVTVCGLG
jgi:hypothetical protein